MEKLSIKIKGIVGNLEEEDVRDINETTYCVVIKADTEERCIAIKDAIKNGTFDIEE